MPVCIVCLSPQLLTSDKYQHTQDKTFTSVTIVEVNWKKWTTETVKSALSVFLDIITGGVTFSLTPQELDSNVTHYCSKAYSTSQMQTKNTEIEKWKEH